MSSTVEKIKSKLSIVDVIGSYIKLIKAGSNYKAKCPFHNEKTPSFFVSPQRDAYHCFGCGRGGDIFNFIQEIEGVDFYEALKILAQRAGVDIDSGVQKNKKEREILFEINKKATSYFKENLKENKKVKEYLSERGLSEETLSRFDVGFAKDLWRGLLNFLSKDCGYNVDLIEKAGLAIRSKDKNGNVIVYDRFRSRIMFPIEDSVGRVVGFSGRIFGKDETQAKYINSPQTSIYDKSKILYGFSKAKESIRKLGFAIIVEGQIDVLMSHQAGFSNTVAVSGTSLTKEHINLIKRFTDNIVFAFDKDKAGLSALKRASMLALSEELNVKVAIVPDDKDPADLIKENPKTWKESIKNSIHIVEYLLSYYREENKKDDRNYKLAVKKEIIPIVASIGNKFDQAHFVTLISRTLNIPESYVFMELEKVDLEDDNEKKEDAASSYINPKRNRINLIRDQLIGIYLWQNENQNKSLDSNLIITEFKKIDPEIDYDKYINELKNDVKSKLAFEAELYYKNSEKLDEYVKELFINFEMEMVNLDIEKKLSEEKEAENANDEKKLIEIKKEIQELINKRNNLKNNLIK